MKTGKVLLVLGLVFGVTLSSFERASAGLSEEEAAKRIQRAYRKYRVRKNTPPKEFDLMALLNKFLPQRQAPQEVVGEQSFRREKQLLELEKLSAPMLRFETIQVPYGGRVKAHFLGGTLTGGAQLVQGRLDGGAVQQLRMAADRLSKELPESSTTSPSASTHESSNGN